MTAVSAVELSSAIVQRYVYQKLMEQMKTRGFVVLSEAAGADHGMRLRCAIADLAQGEFDICIDPQGSIEVQVEALKGGTCLEVVKLFEQMVGELRNLRNTGPCHGPAEEAWQAQAPI